MARYTPETIKPRQKTIAALLAAGSTPAQAAKIVGVSTTYVNLMLKGELFNIEIDEARRALIGERLGEYTKLVSEQLEPNLRALIAVRDARDTKPGDRLRAIELINASVVPRAHAPKPVEATMRARIEIAPETVKAIEAAATEADV